MIVIKLGKKIVVSLIYISFEFANRLERNNPNRLFNAWLINIYRKIYLKNHMQSKKYH